MCWKKNVAIKNLETNLETNLKKFQKLVEEKNSELEEKNQTILNLENKIKQLKLSEKGKEHEAQMEKQKAEEDRQQMLLQKKEEAKKEKISKKKKKRSKIKKIRKKKSDDFSCKNEKFRKSN